MHKFHRLIAIASLLSACASLPPSNTADLCAIFQEKPDWYEGARAAEERWAAPIPVVMAIMKHESGFVDDARPARIHFLGFPLWRPSSAYGYGQAKDDTWEWYQAKTGRGGADRDDFADAADFIAWYLHQSFLRLGIAKTDAYAQYLAYHEGQAGFRNGAWESKPGLKALARRVSATAERYRQQLNDCAPALEVARSS
jgi:hypothetical protein